MCIELSQLTLRQGNRTLLKNINLHLHRGEKIGLIGPNGSGKTTLLKALAGLLKPASGRILLECRCLSTIKPEDLARQMAILLQEQPADMPLNVQETIELSGLAHHSKKQNSKNQSQAPSIEELIAVCHLESFIHKPVNQLSGGERQRVFLAQALYQAPSVLLLDEPCNHLDVRHMWQLLSYCKYNVDTVIASYHDFNLAAAMCDRLILLADDQIRADGSPQEVLTPDNLKTFFGVDSEKLMDNDGRQWIKVNGAAA